MSKAIYLCVLSFFSLATLPTESGKAQTISTVAGNGSTWGFSGDGGAATAAGFSQTPSVYVDATGTMYIGDLFNSRIRKVDPSGIITTFAGNGASGYVGDGGPATAAYISHPSAIIADAAGNILFCDEDNGRIRKVSTSGMITTIAGQGSSTMIGDGGPATAAYINAPMGLKMDGAGNMYLGGYFGSRVRKINTAGIISTIAGNGTWGYSGDGGAATAAKITSAAGIAVDAAGNVYFADQWNNVVRKVNTAGIISTIAGGGTSLGDGGPATAANLNQPADVKFDAAGNLYICDSHNERIRMVNAAGIISTVVGNGIAGYSGDGGAATAAKIFAPLSICFDTHGSLYIADDSNSVVRKVTPAGVLATRPVAHMSASINLFPNPGKGTFYLKGNVSAITADAVHIAIADVAGHIVYTKSIATSNGAINAEINPGNIPDGIYLVHITADGEDDVLRLVIGY